MGSLYGVDNTGLITTAAGIKLPTAGGTAATLAYYETGVNATFTLSGPWSASRSLTCTFYRIGAIVYMLWPDLPGTAVSTATTINSNAEIPARFNSINNSSVPINVYSGLSPSEQSGSLRPSGGSSNGLFTVTLNSSGGSFILLETAGMPAGYASWITGN